MSINEEKQAYSNYCKVLTRALNDYDKSLVERILMDVPLHVKIGLIGGAYYMACATALTDGLY